MHGGIGVTLCALVSRVRGRTRCSLLRVGVLILVSAATIHAGIFGTVRGIVHDPQHRPIPGATVTLRARSTDWTKQTQTNADGEFVLEAVPVGDYVMRVVHSGFKPIERDLSVVSGSAPILHFPMELGTVEEKVVVSGSAAAIETDSPTTQSTIYAAEIQHTPGAERATSLAMITDFVPGAYIVHDQLHIRGGHQATWLVDGVPVPNTNIADTVGPQFHPRDVETVEIQRGGYSAEYGDRTYGVFNVITRSGFERDREGELVVGYGSNNETDNQLSFGDHTQRFAYYVSLSGRRTDFGLMAPSPEPIHDLSSNLGGFVSLIFNASPSDQLRLVVSARHDHFQVPNTPDDQAAGIRDLERERDAFANFSWVHTVGSGVLLTVSPLYHYNRAAFDGGLNDTPLRTTDHRASQYAGGQVTIAAVHGRHNARAGFYAFHQQDDHFFGLQATDGSGTALQQRIRPGGHLEAGFLEDQFKVTPWLSLSGGIRLTNFSGAVNEKAASPRFGAAITIPGIKWVLRGSYSRYYQAPPLSTVSGPLLDLALSQGFDFLPLRGERDESYEVGVAIPFRGWVLDSSLFRTHAHNFFDHEALENSNLFLPLTIQTARIRGGEISLRSPRLWGRARLHLVYSHQFVEGAGAVSGGLTDFEPPEEGFFFLDHDQRDTLSLVIQVTLPWQSWLSTTVHYGSGFLNGDGPGHLSPHTTLNLATGRSFGERWAVKFTALNLSNARFLVDKSNTFGGTHFNYARQFMGEVRYRFHF